jgi:hypothetical protein
VKRTNVVRRGRRDEDRRAAERSDRAPDDDAVELVAGERRERREVVSRGSDGEVEHGHRE